MDVGQELMLQVCQVQDGQDTIDLYQISCAVSASGELISHIAKFKSGEEYCAENITANCANEET